MHIAETLLNGPRGRRLCLSYLIELAPDIRSAVVWTSHRLDPHPGTIIRFSTDGSSVDNAEPDPTYTEADIAALIRQADLTPQTPDAVRTAVRDALRDSIDSARYWQEPDGADVLAALPDVRQALARVAEHIAAALPDPIAPAASDQWAIQWVHPNESTPIPQHPSALLAAWTREQREAERRASADRRTDPTAGYSGEWWSIPTDLLGTRPRQLDALEFVEDAFTWDVATAVPVHGTGRILEIDTADAWANLCRRFPMEVTASRRHDWYRVTGRDGRWLIPDWERVAEEWDAVHLTTLAYLTAATRLIIIDDEYATVIGGWAPDATIWLGDTAGERDEPREEWTRAPDDTAWTRMPHLAPPPGAGAVDPDLPQQGDVATRTSAYVRRVSTPEPTPQSATAVWYFVGATFIFAMPNLLFGDLAWWARIAFIALGFVVMIAGFFQLRRELAAKRQGTDPGEAEPPR